MDHKKRTATEASAVVALAVAVSFALSGAYIAAAVAGLIGVLLFVLYEKFGIESATVSEEDIEFAAEEAEELIEEKLDELDKKK